MKNKLTGIYPISPNYIDSDSEYLEKCFIVINSGISIFQFRAPNISSRKRRFLLNNIYKYCIDAEVQLIINNDYYLIKNYEGAGIHVGRKDLSLKNIKKRIGSDVIIGYSCGSDINSFNEMKEYNISYFSVGAAFPSKTKKDTNTLTDEIVKDFYKVKNIPMCIIGGIDISNISSVTIYKPDMIAISNGIFREDVDNIKKTIHALKGFINEKY